MNASGAETSAPSPPGDECAPSPDASPRRALFDPFTIERDLALIIGVVMLAVLLGAIVLH